jgi:hypothetical protein
VSTPPSTRTLIEQGIARGEPMELICDTLNVTPRAVQAAFDRMTELLAEDVARVGQTLGRNGHVLPPINHGTHSGFNTHRSRSIPPCMQCAEAERRYQAARARRQRKRAERAA